MAGGSGGFYRRQPQKINDSEINGFLREKLREYNSRDTEAVNRHIRTLRDALEQKDEDVIRTLFGGSLSRHTYVNGLSDVDVLMIVNDSALSGQAPKAVIRHMEELIRQRLPNTQVKSGDMAVTVTYSDGIEIQVLPAIRTKSGVRVAAPNRNQWSRIVQPEKFAQELTQVNQANNGQVIPTIKLTKAIANRIIQSDPDKISGYHIESLAIDAFKNYRGQTDLKSMINRLCDFASGAVLNPIKDSTGQSRHVDGYMGQQGSRQRRRGAKHFQDMKRRLNNCKSKSDIDNLFNL